MDRQDQVNREVFANVGAVNWLARIEGFVDDGERAAFQQIADEIRGKAILDLGVGGGRTTEFLQPLAREYVAVDYLPEMVACTRVKFPSVDVRLGDARDLTAFRSDHFDLVTFSFAGIDAISHTDRAKVFNEVRRVLKPGGIFWFSTLNSVGKSPRSRPWHVQLPSLQGKTPVTKAAEILRTGKDTLIGIVNFARLNRLKQHGDGWLVAPFAAHTYGLLVHYTTLHHQFEELAASGFATNPDVFDVAGHPVHGNDDLRSIDFFNILARKKHSDAGLPQTH